MFISLRRGEFPYVELAEFVAQIWLAIFYCYTRERCPRGPSNHGDWSGSWGAIIIFLFSLFFSISSQDNRCRLRKMNRYFFFLII